MQSLWKLVNKPRIDDWSPLAKFYYADEALSAIASELDSFDGRRDPDRCNQLVNKLRQAQDRVLHIISEMLMIVFPHESDRACRDYRVKFPDEIIHDNLPGQLWFGAECLAAGSNIVDHEAESETIRPMARALTKHLDKMREILKDQALRDPAQYSDKIKINLRTFDDLFAQFEFNYVSAMVPVKSVKEYDAQLDVAVLFSESLTKAMKLNYITQEQIDDCDPNVIIALPRLAIVWGLLYYPEGALNVDLPKEQLSEMFRHFHNLLVLIRNLLVILSPQELRKLEMCLVTGNSSSEVTFRQQPSDNQSASLRILENEIESMPDVCANKPARRTTAAEDDPSFPLNSVLQECTTAKENAEAGDVDQKLSRSMYVNSENLIHRLFVCIAGVADQLQTNYSADVRKVLKMVLQPVEVVPVYEVHGKTASLPENEEETGVEVQESLPLPSFVGVRWVPDSDCDQCTACESPFTMVRRRHHCRNCGRIFCARCSANAISIPELGYDKKVRVCNLCFMYRVNPFSSPGDSGGRLSLSGRDNNGGGGGGSAASSTSNLATTMATANANAAAASSSALTVGSDDSYLRASGNSMPLSSTAERASEGFSVGSPLSDDYLTQPSRHHHNHNRSTAAIPTFSSCLPFLSGSSATGVAVTRATSSISSTSSSYQEPIAVYSRPSASSANLLDNNGGTNNFGNILQSDEPVASSSSLLFSNQSAPQHHYYSNNRNSTTTNTDGVDDDHYWTTSNTNNVPLSSSSSSISQQPPSDPSSLSPISTTAVQSSSDEKSGRSSRSKTANNMNSSSKMTTIASS